MEAINYIDNLDKEELFYSTLKNDGAIDIYIKFQYKMYNNLIENVRNEEELNSKLNQIKENEAYLIKADELENIDISILNIQYFNEYVVVYKK